MYLMCGFSFYETERVYDGHKSVINAAPVQIKLQAIKLGHILVTGSYKA